MSATTTRTSPQGRTRATPKAAKQGSRARSASVASTVVMIVIGLGFVVPLLWVVLASFDTEASLSVAWPDRWSLGNFSAIWNAETTFRPLLNSLILCGGATIVTMCAAILCAYPMSRFRFKAKRPLLLTVIFSTGLPITAIMIPVYSLFVQVNLVDSMGGAILFLGASSLPYAIFLTKGFMDGVPVEIEESAWTEGAGVLRALWSVVIPLMRSGLAVATIFTFVSMWGNFFVPFMLLLSPENLPAAVTLYTFSSQYGQVAYGQLAAFSIFYSLPVVALYLFLGRSLGQGFAAAGGVKG
ncbi:MULTISPECIES: carbohydrate ABC transporter permease [Brachybacterium]|uniref:Sugar ABC transporter permease n=1 Tax=Brachybacterium alimentarium TaxID=47845 RepID=A0A2A3YMX6_9MICO|nr:MULTISPECIES: carbohydrate ABC transporter permease [Brachybacterium]PCC36113.1 sugar ABC transporter permease [Brachybacterium alimentarium]PCC40445.1 sugar ABC transporter permease [Brachybacterium alimentarium]RCS67012.1 carbohydrate ABC transporter permease [Brachybacterium sp. JB7]RCS68453.1 carbohydrate ABC transporter permease [Brachybacterium alimentarium]RCS76943.1 carbohydrate ABC transporter permease [Brachybacterium alimentarium]